MTFLLELVLLLVLWLGVSHSQTIVDDDVTAVIDTSLAVLNTLIYKNDLNRIEDDRWCSGIRPNASSPYNVTCNWNYEITHKLYQVKNGTSVTVIDQCGNSNLFISHHYQRSKSSKSMIQVVVTLINHGTSDIPIVQYRKIVDYFFVSYNRMYNVFPTDVPSVILACATDYATFSGVIEANDTRKCISDDTGLDDWKAVYEFRFGPIAPGKNVSFHIFYGGTNDQESAIQELAKNCVEMASFFEPGDSPDELPYTYYVGFSGVGGNQTTFGSCPSTPNNSPKDTNPNIPICFSSKNTVVEKTKGIIPMTELKIGDYVQTGSGHHYTQVYGFGHHDHDHEHTFLQIQLADDDHDSNDDGLCKDVCTMIEISHQHLIFVSSQDRSYAMRAEHVVVGDWLSGRRVVQVNEVIRQGAYAPLTMSGVIAINGITASSYVDLLNYHGWYNRHIIAHIVFTPQRFYCHYMMNVCQNEIYINGYSSYTRFILLCSSILNKLGSMTTRFVVVVVRTISGFLPMTVMAVLLVLLFILYVIIKNGKQPT